MRQLQQIHRISPHLTAYTCSHVTKFCKALLETFADQVVLDASGLDVADPFGLSLTAATLQELRARSCDVVVRDIPVDQFKYLERMDFFRNAGIEIEGPPRLRQRRRRDLDLMELRQINAPKDSFVKRTGETSGLCPEPP